MTSPQTADISGSVTSEGVFLVGCGTKGLSQADVGRYRALLFSGTAAPSLALESSWHAFHDHLSGDLLVVSAPLLFPDSEVRLTQQQHIGHNSLAKASSCVLKTDI